MVQVTRAQQNYLRQSQSEDDGEIADVGRSPHYEPASVSRKWADRAVELGEENKKLRARIEELEAAAIEATGLVETRPLGEAEGYYIVLGYLSSGLSRGGECYKTIEEANQRAKALVSKLVGNPFNKFTGYAVLRTVQGFFIDRPELGEQSDGVSQAATPQSKKSA